MQRIRISFENLLHIIQENNLTNFTLLLEDFGKEYVIESRTTEDTEIQNTIHSLTRIVLMYPVNANFKIVLKPSKTANASSVRTIFFSRTDPNTTHQLQPQAQNVGLGSVESYGLGAFEKIMENQTQLNKREIEQERKVLLEEFSLRLEKDRLKAEQDKLKEEKQAFESDKKNIIAKKIGEGLGAFALNAASQHPQLGALIGQLNGIQNVGLGSVHDDEYNSIDNLKEDLQNGNITVKEVKQILTQYLNGNLEKKETYEDE